MNFRYAIARASRSVEAENILIGEGIDGLLGYVVRMFIEPGDKVVTSAGAYPTFNYHVAGYGGCLEFVPYCDDHEDPEGLLEFGAVASTPSLFIWQTRIIRWELGGMPTLSIP